MAIKVDTRLEPVSLKANTIDEASLMLCVSAENDQRTYWCECDIKVKPPISLAHDRQMSEGRTRIGILNPGKRIERKVKVFTRRSSTPDDYPVSIVTYFYDEEGVIAERVEQKETVKCEA